MRIKEAVQKASVEVMLAQAEVAPKVQEIANRKWVRVASKVLLIGLLLGMMAVPVLAADGAADIFAKGEDLAKEITEQIKRISTVLAGLCIAVCALLFMFSSNQRTVDGAKSWGIRILVAYGIIMAAPTIIETVKNLTAGTP